MSSLQRFGASVPGLHKNRNTMHKNHFILY